MPATRAFLALVLVLACGGTCVAHDPGLSSSQVRIGAGTLSIRATFASAEIAALQERHTGNLEKLAGGIFEVWSGGTAFTPLSVDVESTSDGTVFRVDYPPVRGANLTLRVALVRDLPTGHRHYVLVRDEGGRKVTDALLTASSDTLTCGVTTPSAASQAVEFFKLGVEHILSGWDHLSFLVALLLGGFGMARAAGIITSFTVAHSLTLGLAALGVVELPPFLVEPVIAASIVYVAVENVLRRELARRWFVTFAFGLVHGFGFASVLRETGIGSGAGILLPLFGFNLGVEAGQLAVALLALPLISRMQRQPRYSTRLAPACSILLAVAGACWLVQRLYAP
jgi:hydrogenase/urease accessory protein HupE